MAKVTLQDRERIQEAMEKHPDLAACFLEMIDTMEDTHHTLNRGDDAEEAVLKVINKTGLMILQEWMLKKNRESEIAASKTPDIRPHKKKSPLEDLSRLRDTDNRQLSNKKKV